MVFGIWCLHQDVTGAQENCHHASPLILTTDPANAIALQHITTEKAKQKINVNVMLVRPTQNI